MKRLSALLVGFVASACVPGCGSSAIQRPPAWLGTGFTRQIPSSVAGLPLTDETGHETSLADYRGRYVVLTDFLTLCQDVCPLTSANFAVIDRSLAAAHLQNKVQLIELTVDPERDTPARLHAYRQIFHAPANWSLLTASPPVVAEVWKFFGAAYQRVPEDPVAGTDWMTGKPLTYDVDHSDVLIYITPQGAEKFVILGLPNTNGRPIPTAMQSFLSDLGRDHQLHPAADTWTVQQALSVLSFVTGIRISQVG